MSFCGTEAEKTLSVVSALWIMIATDRAAVTGRPFAEREPHRSFLPEDRLWESDSKTTPKKHRSKRASPFRGGSGRCRTRLYGFSEDDSFSDRAARSFSRASRPRRIQLHRGLRSGFESDFQNENPLFAETFSHLQIPYNGGLSVAIVLTSTANDIIA